MAPRADLPRSLRRAAARGAGPRGRAPSRRLRDAAAAGLLTTTNTRAGSAGRRAVDAEVYKRRTAGRSPGVTARTAAGHEAAAVREATGMSAILVGRGWVELEGLSRGERVRAARYAALASNLAQDRITPAAFRRRVSRWAPIAGERFEATPFIVTAINDERHEAGLPSFVYTGRRT